MTTTTIDFLKAYNGPGSRELRTALAALREPTGFFQSAASAVAGHTHEGVDVLTVFAAWAHDEACGDVARELSRVAGAGAGAAEPSAAQLRQTMLAAADLIEDAIDTHIYDEQNGDVQPHDCPYAAMVAELRERAETAGGAS